MPFGPYDAASDRTVKAKEDVHDIISRIDIEKTPVVSAIPIKSTHDVLYRWLTDSLEAPDPTNNLEIGGDMPVPVDTVRVESSNYVQQFHAELSVSATQEAVAQFGMDSEIDTQRSKKTIELKRHVEARVLSDGTQQAPTPTNANLGLMDGLSTQIATNVDSGGVFNQAQMDALMATIFNAGGEPGDVYCDSTRKQEISDFTATDRRAFQAANEVHNTVEVYESDFGEVRVHYHWQMPATVNAAANDIEVGILDHSLLELRELQPLAWEVMAKTGKATRELCTWQLTLANRNELGHGAFKDL